MKKFLALILSLICAFAVAFTACVNIPEGERNDPNLGQVENPGEGEGEGGGNGENPENPGEGGGNGENPENPGEGGGNGENPENPGEGEGGGNGENPENPGEGGGNGENPENPGEGGGNGENPENPGEGEGEGGGNGENPENPGEGGGNGENPENPGEGEGGNDNEEPHECTYSIYWSCNENYHWHASTCSDHPNNNADYAPHNYVSGRCKDCKVSSSSGYKIGDRFLDFDVETFNGDGFSSESARGKVLVINFWYVNCGPCVAEIPEIEKIVNAKYSNDVTVLALHASGSHHSDDLAVAPGYVNRNWPNYNMIFGKDLPNDYLFKKCGGNEYPLTVILDAEGIITFIHTGYLVYFDIVSMKNVDLFTPAVEAALKNKKN